MITTRQKKLNSVLVIEDNEIDSFINQKILESCDVTHIVVFENPVTALEYLEQTKETPDIILLDNNLPLMDSFKFIAEFRKLEIAQQSIDIFILSAFIHPDNVESTKEIFSGIIEKPLTKQKLFEELDKIGLVHTNKL